MAKVYSSFVNKVVKELRSEFLSEGAIIRMYSPEELYEALAAEISMDTPWTASTKSIINHFKYLEEERVYKTSTEGA